MYTYRLEKGDINEEGSLGQSKKRAGPSKHLVSRTPPPAKGQGGEGKESISSNDNTNTQQLREAVPPKQGRFTKASRQIGSTHTTHTPNQKKQANRSWRNMVCWRLFSASRLRLPSPVSHHQPAFFFCLLIAAHHDHTGQLRLISTILPPLYRRAIACAAATGRRAGGTLRVESQ